MMNIDLPIQEAFAVIAQEVAKENMMIRLAKIERNDISLLAVMIVVLMNS